jgi:hypothetical protein
LIGTVRDRRLLIGRLGAVRRGSNGLVTVRAQPVAVLFNIAMEVLIAARLGDTETASALLAAGADVNGRNDQGCVTRLQVCMPRRDATTKGSSRRSTALQLSCLFGHTQTAEMLLAVGADWNSKDTVGYGQRTVPLRRRHFASGHAG